MFFLFAAMGCFVFFLPHVLISPYQPVFANSTISSRRVEECIISHGNSTSKTCISEYESSNRFYLFIFCAAQLLMGAGTTPLYSLAPAYIDENVHPKASPIYLGIFFAAAIAGPGLGFVTGGPILNEIYIHINQVCRYLILFTLNFFWVFYFNLLRRWILSYGRHNVLSKECFVLYHVWFSLFALLANESLLERGIVPLR